MDAGTFASPPLRLAPRSLWFQEPKLNKPTRFFTLVVTQNEEKDQSY